MQQVCNLKDKRAGLCKTWLLFEEPGLGAGFFMTSGFSGVVDPRLPVFYRFQDSQRAVSGFWGMYPWLPVSMLAGVYLFGRWAFYCITLGQSLGRQALYIRLQHFVVIFDAQIPGRQTFAVLFEISPAE
ncbi:hypothetical protein AFAE65S_04119 [Alcaligenes phenolicus]